MFRLSLDALLVLDAIARRGSFAAAAEEVHRTTSTLSYTVRKLERDLGVRLFDRSGHRAVLTEHGRLLLAEGRELIDHAGALERRMRTLGRGWEPTLRICVNELVGLAPIFGVVRETNAVRKAHGKMTMQFTAALHHDPSLAVDERAIVTWEICTQAGMAGRLTVTDTITDHPALGERLVIDGGHRQLLQIELPAAAEGVVEHRLGTAEAGTGLAHQEAPSAGRGGVEVCLQALRHGQQQADLRHHTASRLYPVGEG